MIFSSSVSHQDCRPPSSHSANTLSPSHPLSCFHLPSSWKIHPNVTVTSHFTFKKINVLSYLIRTKPLTINLDWTAFPPLLPAGSISWYPLTWGLHKCLPVHLQTKSSSCSVWVLACSYHRLPSFSLPQAETACFLQDTAPVHSSHPTWVHLP